MLDTNVPIMVAPNGARLTQADHPAIPVTIDHTISCALECKQAGAHGLHAHVRDAAQKHLLDAGAYQALLNKAEKVLGEDFFVQITTEAFGIYSVDEQIALVKTLKPRFASMALREIIRTDDVAQASAFYHWCLAEGVGVQHILYGQGDFDRFLALQERNVIPEKQNAVLMVVGRYTDTNVADPDESQTVVDVLSNANVPWMMCAFGQTETQCLTQTAAAGGGVRVGFENSTQHASGETASNNAARVAEVRDAIGNGVDQQIDQHRFYQLLGGL